MWPRLMLFQVWSAGERTTTSIDVADKRSLYNKVFINMLLAIRPTSLVCFLRCLSRRYNRLKTALQSSKEQKNWWMVLSRVKVLVLVGLNSSTIIISVSDSDCPVISLSYRSADRWKAGAVEAHEWQTHKTWVIQQIEVFAYSSWDRFETM